MKWINSQLKKKPGARLVEDLRYDTRDGVAFIDLISVIGVYVIDYNSSKTPELECFFCDIKLYWYIVYFD